MGSRVQILISSGDDSSRSARPGVAHLGVAGLARLSELEELWSRFLPDSEISQINKNAGSTVSVSRETCELVEKMIDSWELTSGSYDPTILPGLLRSGYTFSIESKTYKAALPNTAVLDRGDVSQIVVDHASSSVRIPTDTMIDPGGIGKGLAADIVSKHLVDLGAKAALVNIGGDMSTAGDIDHRGWNINVESPFDPNASAAQFCIDGGAVATSSTTSRRWSLRDEEVHHLIDPLLGRPSETQWASVTVVDRTGWRAEAVATALILGGDSLLNNAEIYQVDAIGVRLGGSVVATPGLERFVPDSLTQHEQSNEVTA